MSAGATHRVHSRNEYIRAQSDYQNVPSTSHPKPQMELPVIVSRLDTLECFSIKALLDCGCTASSISQSFVDKHQIPTHRLAKAIPVYNADGTMNAQGNITEYVVLRMRIREHEERIQLAVTQLKGHDLFLGYEWLELHNPSIDWRAKTLQFSNCPRACHATRAQMLRALHEKDMQEKHHIMEELDAHEDERVFVVAQDARIFIRSKGSISAQLAVDDLLKKEKKTWQQIVPNHYHEYATVFEKESFDALPERRPWDHAIDLIPGSLPGDQESAGQIPYVERKPFIGKVYPLTLKEQEELDKFLEENLSTGRIRPSKSPICSPFFFVAKKTGDLRPVQDYRRLNSITVKNRYPLPLSDELFDALRSAIWFTKLDVRWGYNNIRIKEGDEWKAAFVTRRGLFEPTVMFFGLCNSPSTFQQMMDDIFKDMILAGEVVIYIDDILIYKGATLEEHQRIVKKVLDRLRDHNLYLKAEKCTFDAQEVEYLGHIVGNGKFRMDPVKIQAIKEWPIPQNVKDVQTFLGFTNFYRKYIKGYSDIARILSRLTGSVPWEWQEEQQEAFDKLRLSFEEQPILHLARRHGKFKVETDASGFACGGVLYQWQDDRWATLAFRSNTMSPAERNYGTEDRELLAIVNALKDWRRYLLSAEEQFEIWTDHANLRYFKEPQKINRRQARWLTLLAEYDFTLHHLPGNRNTRADALSRRPDFDRGEADNTNVVLLPAQLFRALSIYDGEKDLIKAIQVAQRRHRSLEAVLSKPGYILNDQGLIEVKGRIFIPNDPEIIKEVIWANHDSPISGHPGQYNTLQLVLRDYWWPTVSKDVKNYVAVCKTCQRTKIHRHAPRAPLHPITIASEPWETISVNLIGPLPESKGFNAILVIADYLTKGKVLVATNMELSSMGWALIFRREVFRRHGLPKKVISDRGQQFVASFIKDLYALLRIRGAPSTAYHPQTDGMNERSHQETEQFLAAFVGYHQDDWSEWLDIAEFVQNDHIHSATHQTPFYLTYGQHPWKGQTTGHVSISPDAESFHQKMVEIHSEARAALAIAADTMKHYYDRTRGKAIDYQVGSEVWLEGRHLSSYRPTKKFEDRWYGPFKVLKQVGKALYTLDVRS